ncbi:protein halfway isoform X2 [Zootermopsis nevadensis]|uniref:Protein halfway n=2 Tax=Zootermopsis nevadensis TaxID=136037 RepID=A0A067RSI5_ZOONE|nr:protein halfway isoform X2 [Zootermopsis nevadensis]XP_021912912.1 protein halfway isoform X2 [Zootermopsis nevadensis]KDR22774.1 Protein halfway [Zootermopsis nevadensis]
MKQLCAVTVFLHMAFLVLGSNVGNSTSSITEEPKPPFKCFHQPLAACNLIGCRYLNGSQDTAVCCHLTQFQFKEKMAVLQQNRNLTRLHIMNATVDDLNMNLFWLSNLESLAFTDGHVARVVRLNHTNLTNLTNLRCLNLSSNHITEVDGGIARELPSLLQLDLSNNNITNFSFELPENGSNSSVSHFWLDISNNTHLWCSNITQLKSGVRGTWNLHILNHNCTVCMVQRDEFWFKFQETILFDHIGDVEQVEEDCKKTKTPCTCLPYRYLYTSVYQNHDSMTISVNCSGKNLTSLPDIPPHTIVLNISNNNITNLKRIRIDPNYQELRELHAENNQIVSMHEIEASNFIKNFQVLDIRANKLTEIETYIYNNAFEFDNNKKVKLAGNKVMCDCSTAQHVRMWLLKNRKHIDDYNEIRCENFDDKVMDLDQNKVCTYPRVWTDYINYILASEVVLLLLLISKVSYDYWIFRTAGYLPWPASKMPKMPCDWVFET